MSLGHEPSVGWLIKLPKELSEAVDHAANKAHTSRADYVRKVLAAAVNIPDPTQHANKRYSTIKERNAAKWQRTKARRTGALALLSAMERTHG